MKFGTSGLRGLVQDLHGFNAALYSTAFAHHLLKAGSAKKGDQIYVAYDHRPSSPSIAGTCIDALLKSGFEPIDCGAIPTPALALYAMSKGKASLMITGSHIPADRNGIKFYRADGEINKSDEIAITAIAATLRKTDVSAGTSAASSEFAAASLAFKIRNTQLLPEDCLSGMKIGVYQHSTVARYLLGDVLEHYGAEIVNLGFSDEFIPLDTESVSLETVEVLKIWSNDHCLDAVVSADGDGDRPLLSDETGTPIRGDALGAITAIFLKADIIVTPITSNSGIEKSTSCKVIRTKVGSPYVIEGMNEASAAGGAKILGFEANGGVLVGTNFVTGDGELAALPTRDSFLPILATLFTAKNQLKSLSALVQTLALPYAGADRLENFAVSASASLMSHLSATQGKLQEFLAPIGTIASVDQTDGHRVTFGDGNILHLRPSGNAPEMRCYVEASDRKHADDLIAKAKQLLLAWSEKA